MANSRTLKSALLFCALLLFVPAACTSDRDTGSERRTQPAGSICSKDEQCEVGTKCCTNGTDLVGLCQLGCDCAVNTDCPSNDVCCAGRCLGSQFLVSETAHDIRGVCADGEGCQPSEVCEQTFGAACGYCRLPSGSGGEGGTAGAGGSGGGSGAVSGAGGGGGVGATRGTGATGGTGAAGSGGSGGTGATGGSGGTGATGGNGGNGGSGGTTSAIAPHTVTSGSVTVNAQGCLAVQGPGVLPAILRLNQMFSGKVTLVITGVLSPIAGGVGVDPFGAIQTCTGGVLNGSNVEQCVRTRASFLSTDNSGLAVLYDSQSTEVMSAPWTPTALFHAYRMTVTSDPSAQTLSLVLEIDGAVVATLTASSVGAAAGGYATIFISQGTVCTLMAS